LQLDPTFVHAWARLGVEHAAAYYSAADKTAGRQALARAAIERALALAPADPVVKIAEGNYFRMATSDQERAAAAFEQVLATAPYHVDALNGLASVRRAQGREAERALLIERALAVEPRNFGALNRLKHHHLAFRDYDRAAAYQQRIVELRPGDLDLRAKLQQIEYYRSGDWAGYGAWRATLRAGVEREIGIVHELDTRRAIARRDWNEALRLAEIEPADSRPALTDNQAAILRRVRLALVHRARSDQATAREHAHNAIRQLDQEIARAPRDLGSWELKAKMHALLGERNLAEESFAQALAVARGEGGATLEGEVRRHLLDLHAMLGDLDRANAEAARQVRLPSAFVHEWRASVELAALWDTPAFKALVADPASNAPLPVPGRQQ
jgi:Tfp pilus assembly protein PilF